MAGLKIKHNGVLLPVAGGINKALLIKYNNLISGRNVTTVQSALDKSFEEIDTLNTNLVANNQNFRFGYDSTSEKYGYILKEADTDVFVPFSSSLLIWGYADTGNSSAAITKPLKFTSMESDTLPITSASISKTWSGSAQTQKMTITSIDTSKLTEMYVGLYVNIQTGHAQVVNISVNGAEIGEVIESNFAQSSIIKKALLKLTNITPNITINMPLSYAAVEGMQGFICDNRNFAIGYKF